LSNLGPDIFFWGIYGGDELKINMGIDGKKRRMPS
jgi:hypothetical protein